MSPGTAAPRAAAWSNRLWCGLTGSTLWFCCVKAQSSSFAPQAKRSEPPLTSRFVVPCCPLAVPQVPLSCGPSATPQALSGSSSYASLPTRFSNLCSIAWFGGDLARPGLGSADRGAAGAVRGAARRRPGHCPRTGRQGRTVPPRRRHQDLELDATGTPAPARGVPLAPGRLPRSPTDPGCRCLVDRGGGADAIQREVLRPLRPSWRLAPCMPSTDLRPHHARLWLSSCGSDCPLVTVIDRE